MLPSWVLALVTCCVVTSGVWSQDAGVVFDAVDLAVADAGVIADLDCTRTAGATGRVVWVTIDGAGAETVIYDTEDAAALPTDYAFVDGPDNPAEPTDSEFDFSLVITVTEATAMLTRCTVTDDTLDDVQSTISIFRVTEPTRCFPTPAMTGELAVGTSILLVCSVDVSSSTFEENEYDVIISWQEADGGDAVTIGDSRSVSSPSTHTFEALAGVDGHEFTCNVMVSRPSAIAATVPLNLGGCPVLEANVEEDEEPKFTLFYFDQSIIFRDGVFQIGVMPTAEISCVMDRNPVPVSGQVRMQQQEDGATTWTTLLTNTVSDTVIEAAAKPTQYRCINFDVLTEFSGVVTITDAIAFVGDVETVNSRGNPFADPATNVDVLVGDYITCRPLGGVTMDPPLDYIWRLITGDGPAVLQFPNEVDGTNRLVVSENLGASAEVQYRCIGTNVAIRRGGTFPILMDDVVRFTAVTELPAGIVFDAGDSAHVRGSETTLMCRVSPGVTGASVLWATYNAEGDLITQINDPAAQRTILPLTGYALADDATPPVDPENCDLIVTAIPETSIFTRCTVSAVGYATVSRTTLLFLMDQVGGGCRAAGFDVGGVDLGDTVIFAGCEASASLNEDAGVTDDEYHTINYWQLGSGGPPLEFAVVEPTKVIGSSSEVAVASTSAGDGNACRCGIQVNRPRFDIRAATIDSFCDIDNDGTPDDFILLATENDLFFSLYYGDAAAALGAPTRFRDDSDDTEEVTLPFTAGQDVTCVADRHPPIVGATVVVERLVGDGDWTPTGGDVLLDVPVDTSVRCAYVDGGDSTPSAFVTVSDTLDTVPTNGLDIVRGGSTIALNEADIYDIFPGEYFECRVKAEFEVFPRPRFLWRKVDAGVPGPILIAFDNVDNGGNRLVINEELGGGAATSYRCMAENEVPENPGQIRLPTRAQRIITFRVDVSAGTHIHISMACMFMAVVAFIINH